MMFVSDKEILKNLPGYVWWKDSSLQYLGCNDAILQVLGLNFQEELIGKTDYEIFETQIADSFKKTDLYVIKNKKGITFEDLIYCDSKKITRILLANKYPLFDKNGDVVGIVGTATDITKIKEDESERLSLLENIIALMPGHVYWVDRNSVYLVH